jgi:16S rRNA (guanine966-N2)-methyltransferase
LKVLRRNLEDLGLTAQAQVLPLPVHTALKKLAARGERFSLTFLDPPYGGGLAAEALTALAAAAVLEPQAWVVAEHSRRESLPESLGGLSLRELRRYGDTQVAFYLAAEPETQEHP